MYLFSDCKSVGDKLKDLSYDKSELISLFDFYSECAGRVVGYSEKKKRSKWGYEVFGGINYSKITFSVTEHTGFNTYLNFNNLENCATDNSTGLTFGFSFIKPFLKRFLRNQICFTLSYLALNSNGYYNYNVNSISKTSDYNYNIKFSSIELDVAYRYIFLKADNFEADFNLGIGLGYFLNHQITYTLNETNINGHLYVESGSLLKVGMRDYQQLLISGIGMTIHHKYNARISYSFGNGFSSVPELGSNTHSAIITLGYRFK